MPFLRSIELSLRLSVFFLLSFGLSLIQIHETINLLPEIVLSDFMKLTYLNKLGLVIVLNSV